MVDIENATRAHSPLQAAGSSERIEIETSLHFEDSPLHVDEVREVDGNKRYSLLGRFEDGSVVRVVIDESKKEGKTFLSVFNLEDVSKKLRKIALPDSSSRGATFGVGKDRPRLH